MDDSSEIDEIAFTDWAERLESTSHWLSDCTGPEDYINEDGGQMLMEMYTRDGGSSGPTHFLFLETIVEETSDDLRSDSDRSELTGWPDSDSDAASVIHIPHSPDGAVDSEHESSGSERDIAVPKKRRRRDASAEEEQEGTLSRSSSLLQFECLEKQIDDIYQEEVVFRTSATSDPFEESRSVSSFSFDSLESPGLTKWPTSPDSLESCHQGKKPCLEGEEDPWADAGSTDLVTHDQPCGEADKQSRGVLCLDRIIYEDSSSEVTDSDSDDARGFSSLRSFRGAGNRLRSFRSFDSLNIVPREFTSFSEPHDAKPDVSPPNEQETGKKPNGSQRSAENLSEDSGFGDHISTCVSPQVRPIEEEPPGSSSQEDYYSDSSGDSQHHVSWRGAHHDLTSTEEESLPRRQPLSLKLAAEFLREEEDPLCKEAVHRSSSLCHVVPDSEDLGAAKLSRGSAPNLSLVLPVRREESTGAVARRDEVSRSDPSMNRVPLKTYGARNEVEVYISREPKSHTFPKSSAKVGTRGVHFSPVVSEVSWRESYIEVDDDDDDPEKVLVVSNEQPEVQKVQVGQSEAQPAMTSPCADLPAGKVQVEVPVIEQPMVRKVQVGLPTAEGERVVMELNNKRPPEIDNTGRPNAVDRSPPKSSKPDSPTKKSKFNFFQRFSFKRLSSRHKGGKEEKRKVETVLPVPEEEKAPVKEEPVKDAVEPAPIYEDVLSPVNVQLEDPRVYEAFHILQVSAAELVALGSQDNRASPPPPAVVANKPPLPPQPPKALQPQQKTRLLSARRHFFSQERVLSPEKGPDFQAAVGRFVEGAKQEREKLAQSVPDLAAIDSATRASIRRAAPAIDRPSATTVSSRPARPGSASSARAELLHGARTGILETDLDTLLSREILLLQETDLDVVDAHKKTQSLLNLGVMSGRVQLQPPELVPEPRAKSMEFLLDEDNKVAALPPENELQKGSERNMSEHELRVQRSLQSLDVPDWFRNSNAARGNPEGFLLKKNGSGPKWPGLSSKTTSLSSLQSSRSPTPTRVILPTRIRAPDWKHVKTSRESILLSPNSAASGSPSPQDRGMFNYNYNSPFTRWSTSRLNSGATSASTSPSGSTRSSFNYRQPYLGWRSQERIASNNSTPTHYKTATERLADNLRQQQKEQELRQRIEQEQQQQLDQQQHNSPLRSEPPTLELSPPQDSLNDVRTSIKEVTSAIVHYVTENMSVKSGSETEVSAVDSPPRPNQFPRSPSPRSRTKRLWLESSFVGNRPIDSPETPVTTKYSENAVSPGDKASNPGSDGLFLDLVNVTQAPRIANGSDEHELSKEREIIEERELTEEGDVIDRQIIIERTIIEKHVVNDLEKPSPNSTTLEDVLDSLLGLPSASRSPSPVSASMMRRPISHPGFNRQRVSSNDNAGQERRSCGDLRSAPESPSHSNQPAETEAGRRTICN